MTLPAETRFTVVVSGAERLDRFLADQLQLSRTVAARLIAERQVTVGGKPVRASLMPERGIEICVVFPGAPPRQVTPHDIPLTIVYEDDELAVVDKPAGLVVHPAPGHWDDTLVNALAARGMRMGGGDEGRPGIVHRLDKDTSACWWSPRPAALTRSSAMPCRRGKSPGATRPSSGVTWARTNGVSMRRWAGILRTESASWSARVTDGRR